MTKHFFPLLLISMTSCMSGNGNMMEDSWGGSVKAPGSFVALTGTEELKLPAAMDELSAFLGRNGAVFHSVGRTEDIYKSVPTPSAGSPCQKTESAVIFSYDLQEGDFVPSYVAYIVAGQVVCVDRQFSYSGT